MRSTIAAAVAMTCLAPLTTFAQEAPPPAAPVLRWEAQVDVFYLYNFTGNPNTQAPSGRVFDNTSNSFRLNLAKLAATVTADPVGLRIDVIYGNVGAVSNGLGAATSTMGAALFPGAFFVEQAFATLKGSIFTLDAGRFVTSAGDEVIETKANWNYSRSLLFLAQPFFHTGLRLGIAINQMLSIQLGVVNGWNNDPDNNKQKTFGGQIALALPSRTSILANTYIGNEAAGGGGDPILLFDLVVRQAIGDRVALSLNADYWKNGDPHWFGVGIKARLGLHQHLWLAPRFEYIDSHQGAYGTDAGFAMTHPLSMGDGQLYEATLTAAIPVKSTYEVRVEFRGDRSAQDSFWEGASPRKSQYTGLIGFLAWFP
jgi:hypothetical protein